MRYFALFDGTEWHTCYSVGASADAISVCCGGTERTHREDAAERQRRYNREVMRSLQERDRITTGVHRRLAPWYDEREAR